MRRFLSVLALSAVAAGLVGQLSSPGHGCIAIPMDRPDRPPSIITLTEQRALMWRQSAQEHMLLSVQYSGAPDEFAWVIPVESKPKVDVENGAPFTELRKLTEIRRPEPPGAIAATAEGAKGGDVVVLERKVAGPYDLAVLQAATGGGLYQWLNDNGFKLSKNARGALDYYVTRKFTFVAARMRPGKQGKETIEQRLREGTIAPIHLSYEAKHLAYPLKVTSGNPGVSKMELYVLNVLTEPGNPALTSNRFTIKPSGKQGFKVSGPPGTVVSQADFPTLRRLMPRGGTLVKYEGYLNDSQRQADLNFD
ncbi:MAG: DUF2330 domain-containing protein [Candidatus Eremiobacterota bacterium]